MCGVIAILVIMNGFNYLAPVLILIAAIADGIDFIIYCQKVFFQ
ncbi:MAG: hypothetical protein R2741_06605 [Methanolobus sp.]